MIFKLEAEQRTTERKSDLTKLRNNGFIPAVIYGSGVEPIKISVEKTNFLKLYKRGLNELVFYDINIAGKEYNTLLKERQIHPVTREILHLDFMVLPRNQEIEVEVPIKYVGTPIGVKEGGIMEIVLRTLRIQCMQEDIPADIEIDISNLNIGEAIHIYQLPQGKWTVKEHSDTAIVTIKSRKVEAEPTPAPETKPEETPPEPEAKKTKE